MRKSGEPSRKSAAAGGRPKPEFSRTVDVSRIGRIEHRMKIAAKPEERAALAQRFGLIEIEDLSASLALRKRGDGVVEVTGSYRAKLAQPCVVTLEPVWSEIEDGAVSLFFGDVAGKGTADPLDDEAWPEPIVDGVIDLGEAIAQLMAVALDPYPRAAAAKGDAGG